MKPFTSTVFGLLLASSGSGVLARPQVGGESGLVANIISQLTPFVQSTVAEALAARQTTSTIQTSSSFGSSSGSSSFGSSAGSSFGSTSVASSGSDASRRALDGQDMFDANPQYTYAYQVANDEKQTYITQEESRDGENVQGTYSFVDANGSLVTVKYTANDVDGYNETREVQENFVTIKALPVAKVAPAYKPAPRPVPRPAPVRQVTSVASSSNSDLISRIISQLTPYIKTTVTDALGSNSVGVGGGSSVTSVSYEAVPAVAQVSYQTSGSSLGSSSSSSSESIFGVSGTNNIQVDTPTYNFATEF